MGTKQTASHEEPRPRISPEAYAIFIAQIELQHVWLLETRVENQVGPEGPHDGVEVRITSEPGWRARTGGFDATQRYEVQFVVGDAPLARVDVTFALRFTSEQPMTEDIFHVFHDVNLPLNTWPYLREFVSTTTARMGWLPFTLPALKRGTPSARTSRRSTRPTSPPNHTQAAAGRPAQRRTR